MGKLTDRKFEVILAASSAIFAAIISGIIDKYKEVPIATTIKIWLRWIWQSIFEARFSVWQILIAFLFWRSFRYIISKINKQPIQQKSGWLNYTEDVFDGTTVRWDWQEEYGNSYSFTNLRIVCSCGTSIRNISTTGDYIGGCCPRCNKTTTIWKKYQDLLAIIDDNIERKIYPQTPKAADKL